MKLMRFFGVALVATVLGAGVCASSDDGDEASSSDGAVITTDDGDPFTA